MRRFVAHTLSIVTLAGSLTLSSSLVLAQPASAAQQVPPHATYNPLNPITALRQAEATLAAKASTQVYVVRDGDTLTSIAAKVYGHRNRWPWLWWDNHHHLRYADSIHTGMRLRLSPWHPLPPVWLAKRSLHALTAPAPAAPAAHGSVPAATSTAPHSLQGAAATAFGGCVRWHENGDSYAWGTGDGGGAYQFMEPTWYQFSSAPWGSAGPAAQDAAFNAAIAAGDASAWDADGCPQQFGLAVVSATKINLTSAHAAHRRHHRRHYWRWLRLAALRWALRQAGKPYEWGGTGPYGFDCSGLVYAAYRAKGRHIPRDTYEMLAALGVKLFPVKHPRRGDLAFFGSGHVELLLSFRHHLTFGAPQPGQDVGRHRWSVWWHPTLFVKVMIRRLQTC